MFCLASCQLQRSTVDIACLWKSTKEGLDQFLVLTPYACRYAEALPQLALGVRIPPSGWKCARCDITDNLWLNLTDGLILCGRRFFDGSWALSTWSCFIPESSPGRRLLHSDFVDSGVVDLEFRRLRADFESVMNQCYGALMVRGRWLGRN